MNVLIFLNHKYNNNLLNMMCVISHFMKFSIIFYWIFKYFWVFFPLHIVLYSILTAHVWRCVLFNNFPGICCDVELLGHRRSKRSVSLDIATTLSKVFFLIYNERMPSIIGQKFNFQWNKMYCSFSLKFTSFIVL